MKPRIGWRCTQCAGNWSSSRRRWLGCPLWDVGLPWPCSNEQYEELVAETCAKALAEGIEGIAFGDLFLEDVRAYRENQLKHTGLEPIFPLWERPTRELANEMIAAGMLAK
jgi:diphthamide synthase (EF-2-diphthine--ammonia ligase)